MASVIQLARYRTVTRRDLPLDLPAGDSDLRAVAGVLWAGSLIRAGLALIHRQAFGVEATLALICAVLLPLYVFRARNARDTAPQ